MNNRLRWILSISVLVLGGLVLRLASSPQSANAGPPRPVQVFDLPADAPRDSMFLGAVDPREPKFGFDDAGDPAYYVVIGPASGARAGTQVQAGDAYKVMFTNAAAQSFLCHGLAGFDMIQVWVQMYFPEPCTITLHPDLELADMTNPACPKPGSVVCPGIPTTYTILSAPVVVNLGLPLACNCADFDDTYAFGIYIDAVSCANGPYVTLDGNPAISCKNYFNDGTGWTDMLTMDPNLPGNLVITGIAVCCDNPVDQLLKSFGQVKGLYGK